MRGPRLGLVTAAPRQTPWRALAVYVGRMREFKRGDWVVYGAWVGMMLGLCAVTAGFVAVGHRAGAPLPPAAGLVPLGAAIFTLAIAVDTIGHRTIYKEALRGGEALVHHVIIGARDRQLRAALRRVPRRVGATRFRPWSSRSLSFLYSLVDEVMHWRRYLNAQSDVGRDVEPRLHPDRSRHDDGRLVALVRARLRRRRRDTPGAGRRGRRREARRRRRHAARAGARPGRSCGRRSHALRPEPDRAGVPGRQGRRRRRRCPRAVSARHRPRARRARRGRPISRMRCSGSPPIWRARR